MTEHLPRLLLRALAAAAIVWLVHQVQPRWSMTWVWSSIAIAALFSRPLLDLLFDLPWAMRQFDLRHLAGRHYAYRGRAVDVHEDERHVRWLSIGDVRRIVTGLPASDVLSRVHATGRVEIGPATPEGRISAEALADVLARTSDPETARFLKWLERDVAAPARRLRARESGDPALPGT